MFPVYDYDVINAMRRIETLTERVRADIDGIFGGHCFASRQQKELTQALAVLKEATASFIEESFGALDDGVVRREIPVSDEGAQTLKRQLLEIPTSGIDGLLGLLKNSRLSDDSRKIIAEKLIDIEHTISKNLSAIGEKNSTIRSLLPQVEKTSDVCEFNERLSM